MVDFFRPEDIIQQYESGGIVGKCCVCPDYYQIDGNWARIFNLPSDAPNYSHGYCPECLQAALTHVGGKKTKITKHDVATNWIMRNTGFFGIDPDSLEWIAKELQYGTSTELSCEPDVTMLGETSYVFEYKASEKHIKRALEQLEQAVYDFRLERNQTPKRILVVGKNREFTRID